MLESHPIPKIAQSAGALAFNDFKATMNQLAQQTVEAMGLPEDPTWNVDFNTGTVSREVPDPKPDEPPKLVKVEPEDDAA